MEKIKKITLGLFLIVLVLALLILLEGFLISFAYGLLIALIIYPVCKKLEKKKMPRSLAIFFSLLIVIICLGFIVSLFVLQAQVIKKEIPALIVRMHQIYPQVQQWINSTFGLAVNEQNDLILQMKEGLSSNMGGLISGSFSFAAETLFNLIVIPVYCVLILYYRRTLVDFVGSMLEKKYRDDLPAILSETVHMYFSYIKGMLGVYVVVGILNSIGLLALGVDYAIIFGMVTAFMTIIPYVGIITSSILPITMVWAETNNILYPIGVVAVFSTVQYLEANVIFPYIVGKQIGLNTLVSIIAIVLGGVLWGVSGLILFLPFLAMVKIISSHIPGLKPLHKLLKMPE